MGEFKRIFKYVWPQWPRVVAIVMCVFLIAILFAGSFATVIPMLKVMMGQEGLHGWVNRMIVSDRSGIEFLAVPASTDAFAPDAANELTTRPLQIANVEPDSAAATAGPKRCRSLSKSARAGVSMSG